MVGGNPIEALRASLGAVLACASMRSADGQIVIFKE
jgi:hypothetical protein